MGGVDIIYYLCIIYSDRPMEIVDPHNHNNQALKPDRFVMLSDTNTSYGHHAPEAALYMIPVSISDAPIDSVLPRKVIDLVQNIRHFIVENIRTSRRFLKRCSRDVDIDSLSFSELNGHTRPEDISGFLQPLRRGEPVGVMSEAGCPGVADPGADVVAIAQREGFKVVPLVGPSSILMSLMASGFNGQNFCFTGYLPIESNARIRRIKEMEADSAAHDTTYIFIETPYRNAKLLECLGTTLRPDTLVCVASGITDTERESILTRTAAYWSKHSGDIEKIPTIFLIHRR